MVSVSSMCWDRLVGKVVYAILLLIAMIAGAKNGVPFSPTTAVDCVDCLNDCLSSYLCEINGVTQ